MPTLSEMLGLSDGPQPDFTPAAVEPQQAPPIIEPPQQMPAPASEGGPESLEAQLRSIETLRREQEASLQQHVQFRKGLDQQQEQVNQRGADLSIGERLLAISDSRTDPRLRGSMFDELSEETGIDPRSSANKRLRSLITTLNVDSLGSPTLQSAAAALGRQKPPFRGARP